MHVFASSEHPSLPWLSSSPVVIPTSHFSLTPIMTVSHMTAKLLPLPRILVQRLHENDPTGPVQHVRTCPSQPALLPPSVLALARGNGKRDFGVNG